MQLVKIIFPCLFLVFAPVAYCDTDSLRLLEDLFRDYNHLVRPVRRPSEALTVSMQYKLMQVVDVDEKHQTLVTSGWLLHRWTDYRLSWDPGQYGNVTMFHVPGEVLFLPDICLYNNADSSPTVLTITKADVFYTGEVVWEPPVTYKSMCRIEVGWFPYDEQYCVMKFGSWSYGGYDIDLVHFSHENDNLTGNFSTEFGMDISEFQESIEWDLLSVDGERHEKQYPCCDYPVIDITYTINIRRKKLFYTVNMMFPCIILSALSCFVFYLPCESHNKITLCINVLVACSFFLLLLIEIIPPTSTAVPLIAQLLLFTMIMVSMSIYMTVIIQNIHYRVEQPIPKIVRVVFIHFLGKYLLIFRSVGNKTFHRKARYRRNAIPALRTLQSTFHNYLARSLRADPTSTKHEPPLRRVQSQGHPPTRRRESSSASRADAASPDIPAVLRARLGRVGRNIRYIERYLKRIRYYEDLQADWQFIAMTIDRVMLIFFTFTILGGTLLATLSAPAFRDERLPINLRSATPYVVLD